MAARADWLIADCHSNLDDTAIARPHSDGVQGGVWMANWPCTTRSDYLPVVGGQNNEVAAARRMD